jgi:hypothetical protein
MLRLPPLSGLVRLEAMRPWRYLALECRAAHWLAPLPQPPADPNPAPKGR